MPTVTKILRLEVTPEKYLDACTVDELIELEMLLCQPRYRVKIWNKEHPGRDKNFKP